MASDVEFLRRRLALVEYQLANPNTFRYQGPDRGRRACRSRQNNTYQREARVLRKLLARAHSGRVLRTLTVWRRELGDFALAFRNKHKEAVWALDEWYELPFEARCRIPMPPKPPGPRLIDSEGAPWIVDDNLLALLDDLIKRLQMWLDDEEGG